jgi:hypothetical protein
MEMNRRERRGRRGGLLISLSVFSASSVVFPLISFLSVVVATPAHAQFPFNALRFLKPDGQISPSLVTECSGMVQSLRYSGIFWALGDGGSGAAIVPVTADGKLAPGWTGPVAVTGCKNFDWEDLALDGRGNLVIADVGNNRGRRKQLMLHFVREPKPGTSSVRPDRTLRVHYEDQKEASPDFDCEAVFCADDKIFFLTKRHGDGRTVLYRLTGDSQKRSNPLRRVSSFDIDGLVTAADVSPDGNAVAVLTYTSVWVFDYDRRKGDIFSGRVRCAPFFALQAEAVAFDGNQSLVVANEQGQLFRLRLADFETLRP